MARLTSNKGVALIAVYMVLAVLLVLAVAFANASIVQNNSANFFRRQSQAFNLAEAGLDRAVTWLRAQPSPPLNINNYNPWGGTQNLGAGTYHVSITDLGAPGGGSGGVRRYKVESVGAVGTITRTLKNNLQVDDYARYIWFTDSERFNDTNVWFWTQDRLNGPTHTNGHFNIAGNPSFAGEVRSVDDYIRYFNNGNNINSSELSNPPYDIPNFQNGVTLGVEPTNMPTQALNLRNASTSGGLRLRGNTTVVLKSNGTMDVTNSVKNWNNKNMALPANGALFVDSGSLTISGTLSGKLTVGASSDIIIPNNVLYNNDPRINPNSTDTLGIVAESDVEILSNAPNNLEIDGSIMALNTSFYLLNWQSGPPKGTLTVFGGIIQNERGPVGTFNGQTGQKISGYSKDYSYDTRLLNNPPPFVPTTGDYITLSWED